MFMIVVEAFSKWLEVIKMTQITSATCVRTNSHRQYNFLCQTSTSFLLLLRGEMESFTRLQLPDILPPTAWLRRYVATFKAGMKNIARDLSIDDKMSHFLPANHTTPKSKTGESPADLFLKRHVQTKLDFLKPNISVTVRLKQYRQKVEYDYKAADLMQKIRFICVNTAGDNPKWIPGVVKQRTVSYQVLG